jgi:homoserine dehydrogenase
MFLGRGAGGMPTASAVLGDLLDAAHNLTTGGAGRTLALRHTEIRPIDDLQSAYYIALEVADRPGVLHAISGVLGQHRVSIRLMEQETLGAGAAGGGTPSGSQTDPGGDESGHGASGGSGSGRARLVFVTHPAFERDMQACLGELRHLDVVHSIGGFLRVIGS